jgi:epoxyqueuosine reductase
VLQERKAAGLDAGMAFTYRNPHRSTDPRLAMRDAQALVVGARSYGRDHVARRDPPRHGGRVARYARNDEYGPLRASLGQVARHLRDAGWRALVFADDNSLVDREAAWLAGLGWYGKNANVLLPGSGSWFVLGSVLTDAPLPPAARPVDDGCGSCQRCLHACPTGAIVAPGVVDARRCLAWLVQRPGVFPREHRQALGDRLYGCDDCQDVCPPNLRADRGAPDGPADFERFDDGLVDVIDLLGQSDAELLAAHGRWYIADRAPRWLRRNALVVLGNIGTATDAAVVACLRRCLVDGDPIVRAHAVWAAWRLGRTDLLEAQGAELASDEAGEVRDELAAIGWSRGT